MENKLLDLPIEDYFVEGKTPKEILDRLTQNGNDEELIKFKRSINNSIMDQLNPVLKRLAKE